MALYKGHHVEKHQLVHQVERTHVFDLYDARMVCGLSAVAAIAIHHVTSEPLTCVWCLAGRIRYVLGEFG